MPSAGSLFVDVLPDMKKFLPALKAQTALAGRASVGQFKGLGATMAGGLAVGLGVAGVAATKMALDFDKAFTQISAVTNTSQKQVENWKEGVKDLAGETARSPQELADALYFLASAGLESSKVMPVLELSAKAAAAGLGETQDIARLTANAMNAYADSGLTAAEVTDTLVAAVREGTAEPSEFADAMGRILPVAAKADVEFDEVAASLAVLSNIGLDVNEGVTAMRGLLSALVAPSEKAKDTMKELGITTDGLREIIAERGVLEAMQFLEERTKGNIDQMKNLIPNIRALTGQFGVTGQEANKVAEIFENVSDASGSLDDAFEETERGAAFQFEQAMVDLNTVLLELGEDILPTVVDALDAVVKAAEILAHPVREFVAEVKYGLNEVVIPAINALTQGLNDLANVIDFALGPLLDIPDIPEIPKIADEVENLSENFGAGTKASETLRTGIRAVAIAAEFATNETSYMNAAEIDLRNSIRDQTIASQDAAEATEAQGEAHKKTTAEIKKQHLAEIELAGGLLGLISTQQSAEEAQHELTEARRNLIKVENDAGKGSQEYREAVSRLETAQLNAATSSLELASDLAEYIAEQKGANVTTEQAIKLIEEEGKKLNLTKADVAALTEEVLGLIKTTKTPIPIKADADPARQEVAAWLKELEGAKVTFVVDASGQVRFESGRVLAAGGGFIPGFGGGDKVKALLEPGEFVMRKEAVRAHGLETFQSMNKADESHAPQRFQKGGPVRPDIMYVIQPLLDAYLNSGLKAAREEWQQAFPTGPGASGLTPVASQYYGALMTLFPDSRIGTLRDPSVGLIAGTNIMSQHVYGNALDIFRDGQSPDPLKQAVADWLALQGSQRGDVHYLAYNNAGWSGGGWQQGNVTSPHMNHVHADFYPQYPIAHDGGQVTRTGAAVVEKGETILPKGTTVHVYIDGNEVRSIVREEQRDEAVWRR